MLPSELLGAWKGGESDFHSPISMCAEIYKLKVYDELIRRVRELVLFISKVHIVRACKIERSAGNGCPYAALRVTTQSDRMERSWGASASARPDRLTHHGFRSS